MSVRAQVKEIKTIAGRITDAKQGALFAKDKEQQEKAFIEKATAYLAQLDARLQQIDQAIERVVRAKKMHDNRSARLKDKPGAHVRPLELLDTDHQQLISERKELITEHGNIVDDLHKHKRLLRKETARIKKFEQHYAELMDDARENVYSAIAAARSKPQLKTYLDGVEERIPDMDIATLDKTAFEVYRKFTGA